MGEQIYVFNTKQVVTGFDFLGGNNKQILMLVNDAQNSYFSPKSEEMFVKLLAAVKLSMQDIAIVNLNNISVKWDDIKQKTNPNKVVLWGVKPEFINTDVQKYIFTDNVLYADALDQINADVELKKQLWPELQKMFL